ncbi:hypothetical protein GII34_10665 [Gordonia amarae]|nr:hypothetical protein GII34_10665 [Gordonia amarae]
MPPGGVPARRQARRLRHRVRDHRRRTDRGARRCRVLCRRQCRRCHRVSDFAPIAIVGRSCLLPGAPTPQDLFDATLAGRSLLAPTPRDRWRGVDPAALAASDRPGLRVASATGGNVDDSALNLTGLSSPIPDVERLDPLVRWVAHCAQQALPAGAARERTGLIVGNLSYPSTMNTAFVESVWTGGDVDPRNRFSSGLPVHLVAGALDLDGPAFALDAACASSLYAIKLACDALHDGDADVMLAGGVNGADDLFLHLGFTSLRALSPSGRSRPFHAEADGLVPSAGAALVALERLADAERDGDRILGVIRGVGLSNDGRQSGILAPAASGQTAAMRAALAQAGLNPADVDYVDCHATGTVLGDATELDSLRDAYGDAPLKLGALKGNLGHTITVSGAASLVNVLSAMEAGALPPSLCDTQTPALADTPFTLITEPTPWEGTVKTAAVSNFGFGGNNAHLIVQNYVPAEHRAPAIAPTPPAGDIVICGLGAVTGDTADVDQFRRRALGPEAEPAALEEVRLELAGLGFPPSELKGSLAQQTTVLGAAAQALRGIGSERESTGVVIGMGCDAMIGRQRLRVLHADDDAWLEANAAAAPQLTADGVVGTMPNIPANRVHAQRDFRGFGFTVSSEELSAITALQIAARALRSGELDTVVAGAVDLCREAAHERAADAVAGDPTLPHGDAAVVFVLKRRADAEAAGEPILAVLDTDSRPDTTSAAFATGRFGRTHAASAAVEIAAQVMALGSRVRVEPSGAQPAPGENSAHISVSALGGRTGGIGVRVDVDAPAPLARGPVPISQRYAAAGRAELLDALQRGVPGGDGPVRCALVADNEVTLDTLRRGAADQLARGAAPAGPGIVFADAPISGEIGFAFTGAAAAYPGAGRDLLLAWPEVAEALAQRFPGGADLVPELFGDGITELDAYAQLTGCAVVCQTQAEFSRTVLGLRPTAAIGLSSGETNSLMAFGVWRDLRPMLAEITESGMYGRQITGDCRIAGEAWGVGSTPTEWECWRIGAPREQIDAVLAAEPRAYMTIVQAPDDCVIGGDPQACKRVIEALGNPPSMYLGLDMVIHCEAMTPFTDVWHRIHSR